MKIDFLAYTHFGEFRKKTDVERFFSEIFAKGLLYGEYCDKTTILYRSDMKAELNKQQAYYDNLLAQARKEYEEIMAKVDNPTEEHEYEAYYKTGLSSIESEDHDEYMSAIKERYADTAEHFNRAALVTFYSLLESSMRQLCELLQKQLSKRIGLEQLSTSRNYMESIRHYFDLVLDISLADMVPLLDKFNDVQNIRNKIIHHNGLIASTKDNANIMGRIEANEHLDLKKFEESTYCEVKVRNIKYVLGLYPEFSDLFVKLFWRVEDRMGYPVFKKNLLHLFGFVFKEASVEITEVDKGETIHCMIATKHPELPRVNCRVNFGKPDGKKPVSIIDQLGKENKLIGRLAEFVADHPEILLDDLFSLFLSKKSKAGISVILFPAEDV